MIIHFVKFEKFKNIECVAIIWPTAARVFDSNIGEYWCLSRTKGVLVKLAGYETDSILAF